MELLLRRLALAIGLACGLIGTQAPEFAQQYRQRLAGAVDELSREVATFDGEARALDLTPDEAIRRLQTNFDRLAQSRGRDIADDKARLAHLQEALAAYSDGGPVRRLWGAFTTFDAATARRAWGDFQPAVPTTLEALIVGAVSWALGWAATHIVAWPARRRAARRRAETLASW